MQHKQDIKIETYRPGKILSPFIKTYLVIESEGEAINRIMPDTSLVMAFRFKGEIHSLEKGNRHRLPPFVLSGLQKSGRLINYSKDSGSILVLFKEAGARAFIREPLHELFNNSLPLDDLAGYHDLRTVREQLSEAGNNFQRIDLLEQFLLSRIYSPSSDRLILAALESIRMAKGIIRIKDLASNLCISIDTFEKRFRRVVGISPKQYCYIVRMRSIVQSGIKDQKLVEIALDTGYFDQSHFNKDFKTFTGLTPTDFFKSPVFW